MKGGLLSDSRWVGCTESGCECPIFFLLIIHCIKARMLWQLIYSIFSVVWVMHFMVRGNLLNWHDLFMGKK